MRRRANTGRTAACAVVAAFGLYGCGAAQSQDAHKPAARQIAEAVAAAPEPLRAAATVLGYGGSAREGDVLTLLRRGTNEMICLADDPARNGFHVACYHRDLDPFMAIGRRLRAAGRSREQVQDARYAALEAGSMTMPARAMLYSMTGAEGSFDEAAAASAGGRRLSVVYVPGATTEEMGLPGRPKGDTPWLMLPGTPWAHIMISR